MTHPSAQALDLSNLVFSGFNRRVAALDRRSGKMIWNWRAPKGSTYVTLLLDSGVLIVSVDGYMYGLNPLTGDELWFNPMEGFGTGVTSLVSLNGISSSPVIGAAARNQAQADSSSPGTSGAN